MNIRLAHESDLPKLAALFRQTVLSNAPEHYTPAQTKMWASFASDTKHFRPLIFDVNTFVAFDDSGILGFSGIGEDGHVASAYVRGDRIHQGIGSALIICQKDDSTWRTTREG
ncbi:MAG: hypothetical protein AAFV90_30200 [Cyanobacteria bacterium J06634_5]